MDQIIAETVKNDKIDKDKIPKSETKPEKLEAKVEPEVLVDDEVRQRYAAKVSYF